MLAPRDGDDGEGEGGQTAVGDAPDELVLQEVPSRLAGQVGPGVVAQPRGGDDGDAGRRDERPAPEKPFGKGRGGGLGVPARPGLRDERARVSGHRDGPFLVAGDPAGGLAAAFRNAGRLLAQGGGAPARLPAGAHAADGEGGAGELGGEHGGGRRQKTEERRSGEGGRGYR